MVENRPWLTAFSHLVVLLGVLVIAFPVWMTFVASLTQGGPGQATNILVYKVYNDGFRGQDLGSSSAQSVILMIIMVLLTFIQFRFIERRVHY